MPKKRILLTLADVKNLVAQKYKTDIEKVLVFENNTLQLEAKIGTFFVEDESFIFQIDFEVK
jgi:hypothetical protein